MVVLRRTLLSLLALFVALGLAEGAWRLLRVPGLGPLNNPAYYRYDERRGWAHQPGSTARHREADFDIPVVINDQGFRDRPRSRTRLTDTTRIVALGDSLTFGFGVRAEDAFPARLETLLERSEVLNLGVCGYGTDQEYLLLQDMGLSFQPDVVLVTVCGNDLEENQRAVMYGRAKPCYRMDGDELVLTNVPVPFPWPERISLLYRSCQKYVWTWQREPLTPEEIRQGEALTRKLLKEIASLAARHGAATVVCQTTVDFTLPDRVDGYHVVNVGPELDRRPDLVFAHDPHWNEKGHARVAGFLAAFLRERGLVPAIRQRTSTLSPFVPGRTRSAATVPEPGCAGDWTPCFQNRRIVR